MNFPPHFIPACIAVSAHAALLLSGTPQVPRNPVPEKAATEVLVCEWPIPLNEPPPADDTGQSPVPELKGEPPPPELPDVMDVKSRGDIFVEIDPPRVRPPQPGIETLGPLGNPNGDPEGKPAFPRGKIFDPTQLDKVPRAKSQLPPSYPGALRRDKIDGEVWVEFDVDAKGRVVSARVKRSSDRAFDEPTIQAVMKWRFEPGLSKGMPVPFRMMVPVKFSFAEV